MSQPERPTVRASDPAPETNPWERFGWLMRGVWLVFLVYPLTAIVQADVPALARVGAVVLVVGFVVLYLVGAARIDRLDSRGRPTFWPSVLLIVALLVLAGGTATVIGLGALGFVPFVLSFAMFALPLAWAFGVCAAGIAATAVLSWVYAGETSWSFVIVVVAVVVATGLIRLVLDRGIEYDRVRGELSLVNERERVARDVHDVLGHSLTVVTVKAELASRLIDIDTERARAELADIERLSRQALAEIRATVGGLRIARLGDEIDSARTALEGAGIAVDVPGDPSAVDPRHRTVVAWVLREAVTNVVRHSHASRCQIMLDPDRLVVSDDGRGLDGHAEGNGLRGVRERVVAAGGTLTLGPSTGGRGTRMEVQL